jgi:hypothetical protein
VRSHLARLSVQAPWSDARRATSRGDTTAVVNTVWRAARGGGGGGGASRSESPLPARMETLSKVVGIVASLAAIAAPPAFAVGLVPRVGPMRAIVLALSTRFRRAPEVSQRANELRDLRSMLSTVQKNQYVVVCGPKGVGKTCLVDTALQHTAGVVSVRVVAGTNDKEIMTAAFKAITRSNISFLDHSASARRVLWWHHFLFRQPATVVLQAAEREPTQQHAGLTSSARALTHDFGARVLIDASNNSLPDAATATKREDVLEVEPMQRELLEALPKLQSLHVALKSAELADVVWVCIGGNPADYESLAIKYMRQPGDLELVVALFVQNLIGKAIDNVSSAVASNKRLQALFDKFRESSEVPSAILMEMELVRPSPDKVLRVVKMRTSAGSRGGGRRVLIPADAATALVLRNGITDPPSLKELKALAVPVTELE